MIIQALTLTQWLISFQNKAVFELIFRYPICFLLIIYIIDL